MQEFCIGNCTISLVLICFPVHCGFHCGFHCFHFVSKEIEPFYSFIACSSALRSLNPRTMTRQRNLAGDEVSIFIIQELWVQSDTRHKRYVSPDCLGKILIYSYAECYCDNFFHTGKMVCKTDWIFQSFGSS